MKVCVQIYEAEEYLIFIIQSIEHTVNLAYK